jgi:ubiquinone/menaquinone biosynthesis C-methylase UbiE
VDAALQRRVQRYGWNKAAAYYEQFWQHQLEPAQTRLLERAALRDGEQVLDVACGTGLVTFRAAAAVGPAGEVVGTDVSETMVALADRLAAERATGPTRFARMDGEALTLPDASFDAALCALGLMYMPDPRKALAEMRRVLKPAGRAVAAVWGQRSRCGWAELFSIVDARVASEVCPMFFQLGNGDALTGEFEAAGFTRVRSERVDAPLRYETPEQACGAAFLGGPVALAYGRFTDDVKAEVHAEYLASIEQYRAGEGFRVPGEFVITIGEAS